MILFDFTSLCVSMQHKMQHTYAGYFYSDQKNLEESRFFLFCVIFRVIHHQKIKSWEDFACPLSLCLYSGFLLFATFQNLRFLLLLPLQQIVKVR